MTTATPPMPDRRHLKKNLERIAVPRDILENRQALKNLQGFLAGELTSRGYTVQEDPFDFQGIALSNLLTVPPSGLRPGKDYLLVGAHFDAVPGTPGADDNASGVAALLEAARLCAGPAVFENVLFALFNAEEYGMIGSAHMASWFREKDIRLKGMLSLEMLGYSDSRPGSQKIPFFLKPFYPDTGDFLALVGDFGSSRWLKQAKQSFRKIRGLSLETLTLPGKGRVLPEVRLSDHAPFWDEGYPALLVTDTSFFRNPHYHLPGDTLETLDLDFLEASTAGVAQLIHDFASDNL